MKRSRLLKWNGVLSLVVGVGIFLLALLMDLTLGGYLTSWPPVFLFGVVLFPLALLSLTGIYLDEAETAGRLGFIGFLLAFLGGALMSGVLFSSFVLSVLAEQDPNLNQYFGTGMSFGGLVDGVIMVSGVSFLLGWLLLGIATIRAGVFSRWLGFLLGFGLLLALPLRLPVPGGRSVGFAVWAVSFVGIGVTQWRGHR